MGGLLFKLRCKTGHLGWIGKELIPTRLIQSHINA